MEDLYDFVTTAVAVCLAAVPLGLILWAGFFGLKLIKSVAFVPAGRAARYAELGLWGAYYDTRDDRKELAQQHQAAVDRLRAGEKGWKDRRRELGKEIAAAEKTHATSPTPSNLLILDGLRDELRTGEARWNARAVQAEIDRLTKALTDFDRDVLTPSKEAADRATKAREWYTDRALREPIMATTHPECK